MKYLRIAALALCLAISSAVAFAPSIGFADLTKLAATLLSSATWSGTLTQNTDGGNINFSVAATGIFGPGGAGNILYIANQGADGADNGRVIIAGGGTGAPGRGSSIFNYGNDYGGGNSGNMLIQTGDAASSQIQIGLNSSTSIFKIIDSGAATKLTVDTWGGIAQSPFTATPIATPVAGTNYCNGICVIPTAAANTAVFIGAGTTPTPGTSIKIVNSNTANLVRVKAVGASTINGAVAGGYIGLAANTSLECFQASATNLACHSYSGGAVPTPAGP